MYGAQRVAWGSQIFRPITCCVWSGSIRLFHPGAWNVTGSRSFFIFQGHCYIRRAPTTHRLSWTSLPTRIKVIEVPRCSSLGGNTLPERTRKQKWYYSQNAHVYLNMSRWPSQRTPDGKNWGHYFLPISRAGSVKKYLYGYFFLFLGNMFWIILGCSGPGEAFIR